MSPLRYKSWLTATARAGDAFAAPPVYDGRVIIFGTRGVTLTADSGTFNCPQCGGNAGYRHRRVRRFFTLYFIPVIPLDKLGEYIECDNCAGTFTEAVLSYDPHAENRMIEAAYHSAIKRVMVLMMMADGVIDDDEVEAIRGIYQAVAGRPMSESEVRDEIRQAESDGMSVAEYTANMVVVLNNNGKEFIIKAAHGVAMADGVMAPEERMLMDEIADALQLSKAHYRGLLTELGA